MKRFPRGNRFIPVANVSHTGVSHLNVNLDASYFSAISVGSRLPHLHQTKVSLDINIIIDPSKITFVLILI